MKVLVVFESLWGNTERIARALAEGFDGHDVLVADVASSPVVEADLDLIVAGGPTHAFSMSREITRDDAARQGSTQGSMSTGLREWLETLPDGHHSERIATFDTRVDKVRRLPGSASRAAAKVARKHGYEQVGHSESFYVEAIPGPLLDGELDRAREWGKLLARLITN